MKKTIKYIGFYDVPSKTGTERYAALSAINKIDYIINVITEKGYYVHLISPSWYNFRPENPLFKIKKKQIRENSKKIIYSPSIKTKLKPFTILNIFLSIFWLTWQLVFKTKKREKIFVYHSPLFFIPLFLAKRIKKVSIVLEVEEIYNRVSSYGVLNKKMENGCLKLADEIIAVSDMLSQELGDRVKTVIYGDYSIPKRIGEISKSNKIHVVFAGGIDKIKGGAFKSVQIAELLPKNYTVHICGYGKENLIHELERQITKVNANRKWEACKFHGPKYGNEFTQFLHQCHIAINPQKVGSYMESAFPSKILTYLSHELSVVSTKIDSIINSPFNQIISFSKTDSAEAIAASILSADLSRGKMGVPLILAQKEKFHNSIQAILGSAALE